MKIKITFIIVVVAIELAVPELDDIQPFQILLTVSRKLPCNVCLRVKK